MSGPVSAMSLAPVREVLDFLTDRDLVVLTGAGLSTDSGIPDYRGPGAPRHPEGARGVRPPGVMTFQEFAAGPGAQQRYWARSHLGWARMGTASPNAGHRALAEVDPTLLITQNVDGLHEAAGSRTLVALHGRVADVVCLSCRRTTARTVLQARLDLLNRDWMAQHDSSIRRAAMRPDGDVDLDATADFVVADCEDCGGVLKPDVVFFGENVPADRVARCYAGLDALGTDGALLVAGSSLTVMSGLRFVKRAARAGTPVVIVNRGRTRGDDLAAHKLDCADDDRGRPYGTSEFLVELAQSRRTKM